MKIARSSRRDGERGAADAGHEHELLERVGGHVGARGERERGRAGRRVLQADDRRGRGAVHAQALGQVVAREAKGERLLARDAHGVGHLRAAARSRSRSTLPIALRGRSSVKTTSPGVLVLRELSVEQALDLVGAHRAVLDEDDERDRHLAELVVRASDDGGLGDLRAVRQHGLDIGGIDVAAADDDHLLDAAGDHEHALVIEDARVARAKPAVVVKRLRGRVRVAPVLGHDARPLHEDLPLLPVRHGRAAGVRDAHPAVRDRTPGRVAQAVRVLQRDDRDDRHRLGEPVVLQHGHAAVKPRCRARPRGRSSSR